MPVGGGRARPSTCTPSTARWEAAAGPAGPGRASRRRAERSSRRGRRAGGQAPRRSEIRRPGPKVPETPAEHTKYRPIGGRRNPAGVKGAGGSGGHGRASRSTTPSAARVWRSRGRPGPKAPGTPAEHTKYRPIGGRRGACRAWPGFETTRRAKLAARTASGRAGPAAAGDQAAGPEGARNTSGAHKAARRANCLYSPPTPGSGRPV